MRKYLHILMLLVALLAVSCQGPRVIPRDKMVDIYCDMLLADQQIRDNNVLRNRADTMLVYEAVFNRYGYNTDDYLHSVNHYLGDPERFAKIMGDVAEKLQSEAGALEKEIGYLDWMDRFLGMKRPPMDSILAPFSKDSLYLGLPRVVRDSSRYAGWFRLVPAQEDTLSVVDSLSTPSDSLKARPDSVAAPADSLKATQEPLSVEVKEKK
ncbi:MAG: DUF4296 domain-containing protein [Bacteroidales bacterium]|nr:DUF4296 domain-containing protein [Bacteroidales bacterium]